MSDDRNLSQWDRNDVMEAGILGGLIAAHKNTGEMINWYLNGKQGLMPDFPIKELWQLARNLSVDAVKAKVAQKVNFQRPSIID